MDTVSALVRRVPGGAYNANVGRQPDNDPLVALDIRRKHTQAANRMVDASYKGSACPYHRALYWLSLRRLHVIIFTAVIVTAIVGRSVI